MSLLDDAIKARSKKTKFRITSEDMELAHAYAHGRVSMSQCVKAWKLRPGGAAGYTKMCHALAAYIRDKEDYVQEREES